MGSVSDFEVMDLVYHATPSGIKYIGVIKSIDKNYETCDVDWYTVPGGQYFLDSTADLSRIERIGPMPEGAEW